MTRGWFTEIMIKMIRAPSTPWDPALLCRPREVFRWDSWWTYLKNNTIYYQDQLTIICYKSYSEYHRMMWYIGTLTINIIASQPLNITGTKAWSSPSIRPSPSSWSIQLRPANNYTEVLMFFRLQGGHYWQLFRLRENLKYLCQYN